jgi:hypothetical protein
LCPRLDDKVYYYYCYYYYYYWFAGPQVDARLVHLNVPVVRVCLYIIQYKAV